MFSSTTADFLVALVILANGAVFYARAQRIEREHPERGEEPTRIATGFVLWIMPVVLVSFLGDFLGFGHGGKAPRTFEETNAWDLLSAVVYFGIVIRGAAWVWFGQGAYVLSRNHDILASAMPSSPLGVRILFGIVVIVVTLSIWFQVLGGRA
jgi:hypothetical protein